MAVMDSHHARYHLRVEMSECEGNRVCILNRLCPRVLQRH